MSLKDKLRSILSPIYYLAGDKEVDSEAIAQITQAFKDEGWSEPYRGSDTVLVTPEYTDEQLKAISEELSKPRLTGQEWYDRFIAELSGEVFLFSKSDRTVVDAVERCKQAAKKAAGLK